MLQDGEWEDKHEWRKWFEYIDSYRNSLSALCGVLSKANYLRKVVR